MRRWTATVLAVALTTLLGACTPDEPAPASTAVAAISAGGLSTCALIEQGGVKCWGSNYQGQLGDGTTTNRTRPVDVVGLASGVIAISAGDRHSCALTAAGGVKCWGSNQFGQLGDGTTTNSTTPVDVAGLASDVAAITGGDTHTCALTATGGVKCWGSNQFGQLGDGTTANRTTPVDVVGLASGVAAITGNVASTCALSDAGAVTCWGWNSAGQLGDGTTTNRTAPVDVIGLDAGVASISAGAGSFHACAVTSEGAVKCWGSNQFGQLGDATTTDRTTPVDVAGLGSGIAAVSNGGAHSCALSAAGAVKCWGVNTRGQLGDGTTATPDVPVDVVGLGADVVSISVGSAHSCALTSGGAARCWGSNNLGQVGDGSNTNRSTPVAVAGLNG